MLTTHRLIEFLLVREGFRTHAYDDANPNMPLDLGDEAKVEGTLTVGYGSTFLKENGKWRAVRIGDTLSEPQALAMIRQYIIDFVEPALKDMLEGPLKDYQYDALGSFVYQYGEAEVSKWRLIDRINNQERWQDIAAEWVNGTVFWRGKPLFWARRISELFMYFGLDWRAGDNVPLGEDVVTALQEMGKGSAAPDDTPVKDQRFKTYEEMTDSEKTAFLNTGELVRIGGIPGNAPISPNTKPIADIHYGVNPEAGAKPMEESGRGQQMARAKSARDQQDVGKAAGAAAATMGAINAVVDETNSFFDSVGLMILIVLIGVAVVWYGYGKWREWDAEQKRAEAEENATQALY